MPQARPTRPCQAAPRWGPRGVLLCGVLLGALLCAPAYAKNPPQAPDLQRAMRAFDGGMNAFDASKFEEAASQFEAADAAVPSGQALRWAMRARHEAGQKSRAASHAGMLKLLYGDDGELRAAADEVLRADAKGLQRLEIACVSACLVTVGMRALHGDRRRGWVAYVEPGEVQVGVSFDDDDQQSQRIEARAGGDDKLTFIPKQAGQTGASPGPSAGGEPPSEPHPGSGEPEPTPHDPPADAEEGPSWVQHPGVFAAFAVATAGLGGVTIWSGLDTLNNPGADAVREQCRGQGIACPAYQEGLAAQDRTNALIGVSAGLAVVTTALAIFVTDWGGEEAPDASSAQDALTLQLVPSTSAPFGAALEGRF